MAIVICGPGSKKRRSSRVCFKNGGTSTVFDYTVHLECLIRRWCRCYQALGHIDLERVVLAAAACRSRSRRGTYASIMSLRYPDGRAPKHRSGRLYKWPTVKKNGRNALYLIKFYLPRFHNLTVEEKVSTILHELFHIHPRFNGEFRCFDGRNWAHGGSEAGFEKLYEPLKRDILKRSDPFREVFLGCRFPTLLKRFGDIYADRVVLSPIYRRTASIR